jgi:hypothetical protein
VHVTGPVEGAGPEDAALGAFEAGALPDDGPPPGRFRVPRAPEVFDLPAAGLAAACVLPDAVAVAVGRPAAAIRSRSARDGAATLARATETATGRGWSPT